MELTIGRDFSTELNMCLKRKTPVKISGSESRNFFFVSCEQKHLNHEDKSSLLLKIRKDSNDTNI